MERIGTEEVKRSERFNKYRKIGGRFQLGDYTGIYELLISLEGNPKCLAEELEKVSVPNKAQYKAECKRCRIPPSEIELVIYARLHNESCDGKCGVERVDKPVFVRSKEGGLSDREVFREVLRLAY